MPRNSDGSYSLPAGTIVQTGDDILVSQHNPPFQDVAQAIGNSLDRDGSGGMRANLPMGGNKITNLASGTSPSDAATVGQLASGAGVPIGSIVSFAGATAPAGWLVCGGQDVSRADYAELFAVIGVTYGAAGGSTFRVPDLRGRMVAGLDFSVAGGIANRVSQVTVVPNGLTIAATGGDQIHSLNETQIPSHTHAGSASSSGAHAHTYNKPNGSVAAGSGSLAAYRVSDVEEVTSPVGDHTHSISISSTGGGQPHNNMPPTMILNMIIKASNS